MDAQTAVDAARRDAEHQQIRAALHAVNNVLSPVVGYADLLVIHPEIGRNRTLATYCAAINENAVRASELLRDVQRLVAEHGTRTAPAAPEHIAGVVSPSRLDAAA